MNTPQAPSASNANDDGSGTATGSPKTKSRYGLNRLQQVLSDHYALPLTESFEILITDVKEFVPGGDLMCHIQQKKRFSQSRARFYSCQVLCAIEYLHSKNIVYRYNPYNSCDI